MVFVDKLLNCLPLIVEKLKGHTVVSEIKAPKNLIGHLTGYSVHGYEIQIFCQKRHYRRVNDAWFIPNADHVAYRVFSMVTNDAPDNLKKACELDIVIPRLLADAISEKYQRQAAVDAYLDILAQSLETSGDHEEPVKYYNTSDEVNNVASDGILIDIFSRRKRS